MKKRFIPNEICYRISIPKATIDRFQGEGNYEETLEDHFMYCIVQPLRDQEIPFDFSFDAFEVVDGFGMELRVDGSRFDENSIVENLKNEGIMMGLVVMRRERDGSILVYDDARRSMFLKKMTDGK